MDQAASRGISADYNRGPVGVMATTIVTGQVDITVVPA
jgi:hypothetical protein